MDARRVLVVDDEQPFTEMIRMSLEAMGNYSVCEVNDPTQAVEAAREFKPDLILLDVMMPDMDGGDVAAALAQDKNLAGVRILYMTSLVSHQDAPHGGLISSNHRFLPKPSSMAELLEVIELELGTGQEAGERPRGNGGGEPAGRRSGLGSDPLPADNVVTGEPPDPATGPAAP